jgi:uncharacterized protein YcfL
MINKLLLIFSAFAMTGCASTAHIQPIKTEYKVVMPEDQYFQGCDIVKIPNPKTLTNQQVAQLINDLVKVNKVCHNNTVAIHNYLETAQKELNKRNPN